MVQKEIRSKRTETQLTKGIQVNIPPSNPHCYPRYMIFNVYMYMCPNQYHFHPFTQFINIIPLQYHFHPFTQFINIIPLQ